MQSDERTVTRWYKSSYSGGGESECLEVARGHAPLPVRDSKNTSGPALHFSANGWTSFIGALKNGHLNG